MPFTPTDIAGLQLWLDASDPSTLFQDSGLSTTAASDADPVGGWKDKSGHGNHVLQAASSKRPTLRLPTVNGLAGHAIQFDGVTQNLATTLTLAQPSTLFIAAKVDIALGSTQVISGGASGGPNFNSAYFSPTGVPSLYAGSILSSSTLDAGWCTLIFEFNGNASKIGVDRRTPVSGAGGSNQRDSLTLGAYSDATNPTAMFVSEALLYNSVLSPTDRASVLSYLENAVTFMQPLSGAQIVCDGDSLTRGFGLANELTDSYPAQLANLHPGRARIRNFGVASRKLSDMMTDAAAKIDSIEGSPYSTNVLVVWGGTNDIANGASAATVYSNLQAYVATRQAAGWRVVVLTCLPRGDFDSTKEATRQTLNTSIRAGMPGLADGMADVGGDPTIGVAGAYNNGAMYQADRTHLLTAGQTIVAAAVDSAVAPLVTAASPRRAALGLGTGLS